MRIAVAAALSIALGATLARAQETPAQETPPPDAPPPSTIAPREPFAPVEATRDSLRKPIPSL